MLKLENYEKNALHLAMQCRIATRLKRMSAEIYDHDIEGLIEELVDIKDDMEILNKLAKAGWGEWS